MGLETEKRKNEVLKSYLKTEEREYIKIKKQGVDFA